jgi:hypothetical protein
MKAASAEVLDEIKMSTENYRIGLSKVIEKLLQLSEEHQGHAGAEEIADCSAEEPSFGTTSKHCCRELRREKSVWPDRLKRPNWRLRLNWRQKRLAKEAVDKLEA